MAETRGIEVFGRGANIVDTSVDAQRRGPALGILSLLLGALAAVATAMGVISASEGAVEAARWWAYGGIGSGILAAAIGFVAVVMGRGVGAGLLGMLLGVVGNPWVLTRILEAAGPLLR